MRYFSILLAVLFIFLNSCDNFLDLPRDNPLDNQNDALLKKGLGFSKFVVQSDNNEDEIVNKGETVYLQVYLKNYTALTISGVKASISTTSEYISNLAPIGEVEYNSNFYINDIEAGTEKYGNGGTDYNFGGDYTVSFKVSESTPENTKIYFKMDISDVNNKSWIDSFFVEIKPTNAILNFSKYEIVYDTNEDEVVDNGEFVCLKVFIKNNGTSTANGVSASISTNSSYITNFSPVSYVDYDSDFYTNDITPGTEEYGYAGSDYNYGGNYTVKFIISASTPHGTDIQFDLNIKDEVNNTWNDNFIIDVN